jgi:hypothetical protein
MLTVTSQLITSAPGASRERSNMSNIRDEKPSNPRDETRPTNTRDDLPDNTRDHTTLWNQTKAWAARNRTISGALVGGAAGVILPGVGTLIGAIVGAGVGFASSRERREQFEPRQNAPETTRGRRIE